MAKFREKAALDSRPFPATSHWKKITLDFYSGDRSQVEAAFNLGWYGSKVSGTAWFSKIEVEKR